MVRIRALKSTLRSASARDEDTVVVACNYRVMTLHASDAPYLFPDLSLQLIFLCSFSPTKVGPEHFVRST